MPFDNTPTEIIVDTPASLILEAAIKLIDQPEHWCRWMPKLLFIDGSVAYCAWGATREVSGGPITMINRPAWERGLGPATDALNAVARRYHYRDIADLNDNARTTHAKVLEVMREAAEIARGKL